MKSTYPIFIICLILNFLIGYFLIIVNFRQNKKKGFYGEKGIEGSRGIIGIKGDIGDKIKLDNCNKLLTMKYTLLTL